MIEYKKENFAVYRVGNGFVVHNTNYDFEKKHTHLKSKRVAKQIIDNLIYGKMPKTRNVYLLYSHIRLSDDVVYKDKIQELINSKKSKGKKMGYRNRSM